MINRPYSNNFYLPADLGLTTAWTHQTRMSFLRMLALLLTTIYLQYNVLFHLTRIHCHIVVDLTSFIWRLASFGYTGWKRYSRQLHLCWTLKSESFTVKVRRYSFPERTTNTILCATAPVFVPSPAARALFFRNQSSFQTNATGLDDDTASVHIETPTLTPDSSAAGLLSPASFSTSFEHAVCTLNSSDGMPGGFRIESNDNDKILYTSSQLLEVKEGKKRE